MPEYGGKASLDAEHVRSAIQRYVQTPGPRKKAEKKRLLESTEILGLLQRAIIAHDPPLDEILVLGPALLYRALALNMPDPEAIRTVVERLRSTDTELSRPLSVALISLLISSGYALPVDQMVDASDTPLPKFAVDTFQHTLTTIDVWLQDNLVAEYKKRKLASFIIRSLADLTLASDVAASTSLTLIRRLRAAHVDPNHFADNVRAKWMLNIGRLPHNARAEIARLMADVSDGFQQRFWDDSTLGPLPLTGRRTPDSADLDVPSAVLAPAPIAPSHNILPEQEEPKSESQAHLSGQTEAGEARANERSLRAERVDTVPWLRGLHEQLGRLLEGFNEASHLEGHLREAENQLASSRLAEEEAKRRIDSEVIKCSELSASLAAAQAREAQNLSDLTQLKGTVEALWERVARSETVTQELRAKIVELQGELEEAARARVLFGEQTALEVKNALREKITREVSGLPSLGPDLGEEHFSMVRVRFKNLLILLAENGIFGTLPGVVGR